MHATMSSELNICKKAHALKIAPRVHDIFLCFNTQYHIVYKVIISDYVKGVSLKEWLSNNKDPIQRAKMHDMIKAKIDVMHANGIIHNNLHDDNIIVQLRSNTVQNVLFTDFESSYDVHDKTTMDYNKWIMNDKEILRELKSSYKTYDHVDDVVNYIGARFAARHKEI